MVGRGGVDLWKGVFFFVSRGLECNELICERCPLSDAAVSSYGVGLWEAMEQPRDPLMKVPSRRSINKPADVLFKHLPVTKHVITHVSIKSLAERLTNNYALTRNLSKYWRKTNALVVFESSALFLPVIALLNRLCFLSCGDAGTQMSYAIVFQQEQPLKGGSGFVRTCRRQGTSGDTGSCLPNAVNLKWK